MLYELSTGQVVDLMQVEYVGLISYPAIPRTNQITVEFSIFFKSGRRFKVAFTADDVEELNKTEKEFEELHSFIRKSKFDRLGTFTYSQEEGTRAFKYDDSISEEIKTERYEKIMESQAEIACQINERYIGKKIDVIVDGVENGHSIGRSQWDAPEVDNAVHIPYELEVGKIFNLEIADADNYDFYAALDKKL